MPIRSWRARGALLGALWALGLAAHAAVLATATPGVTLTLATGLGESTPMAVAYVPAFDRYYGGAGGFPNSPDTVFSSVGVQLGQQSTGVDDRGLYFNPTTGDLEAVSYYACCGGGAITGIQAINLDGSGNLLGTNAQLLAGPIAALGNSQTMPAYDPVGNLLYAIQQGTATINVVNRSGGAAVTTITLNLAAAGATPGGVNTNCLGFTGVTGFELVVYDYTNSRALVFNLAGSFIGASALPVIGQTDNNTGYGCGYAKGQFFVFDDALGSAGGWRGFVVLSSAPPAATVTPIPTLTGAGVGSLSMFVGLLGMLFLRRRTSARRPRRA